MEDSQFLEEGSSGYNEQFRTRTKKLAVDVRPFVDSLSKTMSAAIVGKQLLRAATSSASNYRAMCLGRSPRERYAKLCIVVEEADETAFWLEYVYESGIVPYRVVAHLLPEATELAKVFTAYRNRIRPDQ